MTHESYCEACHDLFTRLLLLVWHPNPLEVLLVAPVAQIYTLIRSHTLLRFHQEGDANLDNDSRPLIHSACDDSRLILVLASSPADSRPLPLKARGRKSEELEGRRRTERGNTSGANTPHHTRARPQAPARHPHHGLFSTRRLPPPQIVAPRCGTRWRTCIGA